MFFSNFITTFLLTLSLNVDDFVVGVALGLRKTTVSIKSMLLITLGSTGAMLISMYFGKLIFSFISDSFTNYVSCILLAGLGCRYIYRAIVDSKEIHLIEKTSYSKWTSEITHWEALFLGASLGIDDFVEVIGLAIAGFPIILTVILFKFSELLAIFIGAHLGSKGLTKLVTGRLGFIPGLVLILVGLWQLH